MPGPSASGEAWAGALTKADETLGRLVGLTAEEANLGSSASFAAEFERGMYGAAARSGAPANSFKSTSQNEPSAADFLVGRDGVTIPNSKQVLEDSFQRATATAPTFPVLCDIRRASPVKD